MTKQERRALEKEIAARPTHELRLIVASLMEKVEAQMETRQKLEAEAEHLELKELFDSVESKTKARERGFYTKYGCHLRGHAPKKHAIPFFLHGDHVYHLSQCEELLTKNAARQLGLRVPKGLEPEGYIRTNFGEFAGYRVSECELRD